MSRLSKAVVLAGCVVFLASCGEDEQGMSGGRSAGAPTGQESSGMAGSTGMPQERQQTSEPRERQEQTTGGQEMPAPPVEFKDQ